MTNEQALGRALELLMQVSSLDGSGEVWEFYDYECVRNTSEFKELVNDIDKFLDDEMRREG